VFNGVGSPAGKALGAANAAGDVIDIEINSGRRFG
jgi:hypothetical protein